MTFLLYQRRQQIRQEDSKNSAGAMSLLARIKFEQSKQESDENGIKARGLQVSSGHKYRQRAHALKSLACSARVTPACLACLTLGVLILLHFQN